METANSNENKLEDTVEELDLDEQSYELDFDDDLGEEDEELEEDEIENPKTGSSISWLIIIGVVLSILGVFSYTRNRKIYRL